MSAEVFSVTTGRPEQNTCPLMAVARESDLRNTGLREQNLLSLSQGEIVRKDINSNDGLLPASFETYQIVQPGMTILRFTDLQNDQRSLRSGLVKERGIITSAYVAVDPFAMEPRFFAYLMRAYDTNKVFYSMGGGVRQGLNFDNIRRLPVPDLPLDEQRVRADYLDHETAQIDALVAKQEELLTLLAERKRSVLDVILADVQGERCRLRWLYRPSNDANYPNEEVLSVYREHGVIPKSSRTDNFNKTPENVKRYLLVRPDDLVVNKMKAWQGSLAVSAHRGIVSADYEVLRPSTTDLDPGFAHFLLRSPQMVLQYRVRSRGIRPSQWRLYWQDLADIEVSVPPLITRRRAASQIKAETDAIDVLISKAKEHIALAKERRSALITAAVTGQLDLRTARKAA